jgi:hypothetical protein
LQGKRGLTTATADDGVETAACRRRIGDDDGDKLGDDGVEMTTASSLKTTTTTTTTTGETLDCYCYCNSMIAIAMFGFAVYWA